MENTADFIKYPTLKGSQDIVGIWFPAQWFNNTQRRSVLIKNWFFGCKIYQFAQGDLLKFPSEQKRYCESLDGWPLIYQNRVLCSSKIPANLLQKIPACDLLLIIGNILTTYRFEDALELDPAQWVDLTGYQLLDTKRYSVNVVYDEVADLTEESKSLEQIFDGNIPSSSPDLKKYIEKRQQQAKEQRFNQSSNITNRSQVGKKNYVILWLALASILFGLYRVLNKTPKITTATQEVSSGTSIPLFLYLIFIILFLFLLLRSKNYFGKIAAYLKGVRQGNLADKKIVVKSFSYTIKQKKKASNNSKLITNSQYDTNISNAQLNANPSTSTNTIPPRANSNETKPSRWRKYLTFFAIFSKLSHLVAFRQSDYLKKMMRKFAEGDLEEALRYALPINTNGRSQGQSFGVPKPRNKLSLSERVYGNTSSVYLEPELLQQLQTLYQQSFKKLAKQNRVEEAVFVLVELLNQLEEGIEFLEERKLYKQAMELAITRDAKSELILKLCCLANEWDKAIMIARRDNIFANAIMMLEKDKPELANKLRLEWANTLAEKAEWLAAIDAIWPLKEYRYLAEQWFNNTDKLSGKALVKRFILLPDSIEKLEDHLTILKNNPNYYQNRLEIAQEILNQQKDIDKLLGLLRLFINIIIADVVTYPNAISIADVAKLIELTQDKALQVDMKLPSLKLVRRNSLTMVQGIQHYHSPDAGQRAIYDMVALTDNNYLLALGDAGIIKVDKTGKQLAHFMVATDTFVISHNRLQILALSKREDYHRIHKVDLTTQKIVDLGVIKFQLCQRVFDGINWTIVNNNCVEVINISHTLSIVWRVDYSPEQVVQIVINESYETYLISNSDNKLEILTYKLTNRRLFNRETVNSGADKILYSADLDSLLFKYNESEHQLLCKSRKCSSYIAIPLTILPQQFKNILILTTGTFIVIIVNHLYEHGCDIHLFDLCSYSIKMTINWDSHDVVSGSCIAGQCYFFDKHGRALHVNVNENRVTSFSI